MRKRIGVFAALAAVLFVAATVSVVSSVGAASAAATCTYEQKQANTKAYQRAKAKAARERAAFFKGHKKRAQRAAFVKKQNKRLKRLRAAAACTVPPLPPSSDASCSFMLEPNAETVRNGRTFGRPIPLHEGRLDPAGHLPSLGSVHGIVLNVDFPDAESVGSPSAGRNFIPDPDYFKEVSYGRFAVSADVLDRWVRLPRRSAEYATVDPNPYITDAVTAADPFVDFSKYDFVIVNSTPRWLGSGNTGWYKFPGAGVATAEGEIRFGAVYSPDQARMGKRVINHEFMHTMGLPDLYFDDHSTSTWDPMSNPTPTVHPLGWHKWRFGWLDPPQLTCLSSPGQLEETLTANATPGGKKLVLIPTSPSTTYVLEARVHIGFDRAICEDGILVYDVDSQIANAQTRDGRGVIAIHGPRRCPLDGAAAFHTGEVYEDGVVKVEVLARDAAAFRVRVTRK